MGTFEARLRVGTVYPTNGESLPHKRSVEMLQKRAAKRLVLKESFRDPIRDETINRSTLGSVIDFLQDKFGFVHMDACDFVRGEVLVDSRGTGSLQGR